MPAVPGPSPPSATPPPTIPADPTLSIALVNYLTQFSQWCQRAFNAALSAKVALPGILLQANDAPSGTIPNVFMLQINSAQVLETAHVALASGTLGALVPVVASALPLTGGTLTGPLNFTPLPVNAANDAAAATAGVPVGGVYRNGSILMVRAA